MKIIEVEYGELKSEGFNNKKVSARAKVDPDDEPEHVLDYLKRWVQDRLNVCQRERPDPKESLAKIRKVIQDHDNEVPF